MGKIGRLQRIEGGAITGYPTRVPQLILVEEPGMVDAWSVATSARRLSGAEVRRLRLLWAHGRAGVCHGRTSAGERTGLDERLKTRPRPGDQLSLFRQGMRWLFALRIGTDGSFQARSGTAPCL
jgi:hypothetical protein